MYAGTAASWERALVTKIASAGGAMADKLPSLLPSQLFASMTVQSRKHYNVQKSHVVLVWQYARGGTYQSCCHQAVASRQRVQYVSAVF